MAIVQISRITQRKGLAIDLPDPLAGAELGWATDTRQLYIGNGDLIDGAPVVGNTEILTEFSDVLALSTGYTYKGSAGGYTVQTGLTSGTPVSQSLQSRLDSYAVITDFGATGDGVTDVTDIINNALNQLYCQNVTPQVRRSLFFPAGTYIISGTLLIPPYCKLYGEGPESTIISFYVPAWTSTVSYADGVLVQNGATYYRSQGSVPIGIAISNTLYWLAETLPSYIFRTTDSLQQTSTNIGTNGALPPGELEITSMKFITNQLNNGGFVEAAKDCLFDSVNIEGPGTVATLTTGTADTACIRWNSTGSYICSNVEWNHCTLTGMTWASNTDEQIEGVTLSNCYFDTLYQGVYIGNTVAPAVGPTGFRVLNNQFDNIYAEGIVIVNVSLNESAYNIFYDVGNNFNGTANPATPIIDINGTNNASVGDMFERTTTYSGALHPRIKLNNLNGITLGPNISNITLYQSNVANLTLANQMEVGLYQRTAGITDTLADNVSSARTLFTFDAVYVKAVQINYTIVRGTAVRTGVYTIVCGTDAAGTNLQGSDTGVQNSAPGQTFSVTETASVVSWKYVTTSTGSAGTIYYSITKLA